MSTYDTGVGRALDSMHLSLKGDIQDTKDHISRLRSQLSSPKGRSQQRYTTDDDDGGDDDGGDGYEYDDTTDNTEQINVQALLEENEILKRKLRRANKQAQRREVELEVELQRLREELQRLHRSGLHHEPLERSKLKEPLRPPSRSSRAEYLKTRRAQEALDQKLTRAMTEANDVALRNDALMAENTQLRQEVARLRQENTDLLLFAKDSQTDTRVLRAQVVTNVAHRAALLRRLGRSERDKHQLEGNLASLSQRFVRSTQEDEQEQEMLRWARIDALSRTPRSQSSSSRQPRRAARTRNIRVETWADQ
ncbi:hypothetical protein PTSG_05990 [Salpingoeca rosetta]|uniref:Uncharacterized protein n=1 Tax=Salpingoeca rosetta (strain ATCC 50818 / BSB-021) TaxID=946362 RepID=F2UDD1_SALR5|nr:uncharacterized protein PTSG_05990 [Salpingoeca rosetta]EGD74626.1 hypothetical protein PTSG_05990 [Salpingoeca rosetta]|eukprot:XP_004992883.1 hypothetical protein PTSG_05990 [Salpingoeca rosetta]